MAQRRNDPEATRESILEAAAALFTRHGHANTAVSAIARKADVTKSLIHHHFGSKDGLWDAVKDRAFARYKRSQETLFETHEPDLELVRESLRTYFEFVRHSVELVRIMSWINAEQPGSASIRSGDELFAVGVGIMARGQETGHLRADVPAEFMLVTMLGIVHSWFQSQCYMVHKLGPSESGEIGPEDPLHDAYLDAVLKIFCDGIRARPAG